ncbi:MAG: glutamate--tRNA ligase [Caulobacterales bacterium]
MPVVTRFAPSPTGYLHIGGARTALFNWLFARSQGGKYLLRIEDTDRERSTQAAIDAIHDGLNWLGLNGDEPAVLQSTRAHRHKEVAEQLLSSGGAYRCFLSGAEIEVLRTEARELGRPFRSPWRDRSDGSALGDFTIRLRAPDAGVTAIEDRVQGLVEIANDQIDDLILLRSDGAPTYMLAVVVDDRDMGVTHVIRGDDHLTNAFRQLCIIRALGWREPVYAHIPLIHGPDGAKLSKRHGALGVDAYRDMGFLPEAMRNYLLRLGWSHGDDEIISTEQAIQWFDLEHIGRGPARLDFDKLTSVNAHYLRQADDERLVTLCVDQMRTLGWTPSDAEIARIRLGMPIFKTRAKTVVELPKEASFLIASANKNEAGPPPPSNNDPETRARLARLSDVLANAATWDAETINITVKNFAGAEGVGLGKIGAPLRSLLTGGAPAPDLGSLLWLLGKEEALSRLNRRLND